MGLYMLKVYGVELDVYADVEIEKDPKGTGDSPDETHIDIISIESGTDTQDITALLSEDVIEKIGEQIQKEARNE